MKSLGRAATPISGGYAAKLTKIRRLGVFLSTTYFFFFSSGNEGGGVSDTMVKRETRIPNMHCEFCELEILNIFTCYEIHGEVKRECLERHMEAMT